MAERAAYAALSEHSRGRRHPEQAPAGRTEFQRDRDRIIHSTAFRRLEYKTQVFVNHEGDLFRTRLTHSLEVAQIGRAIARSLGLDQDLVEAIALAHDLGHTPFGHTGQDALNACMQDYGGFEHNLQSLRVVDMLEERYAEFDGLNLTFETREGILKHCSLPNAQQLGEIGQRFLHKQQPSLEAQVANLADEIAYNNHDVDDGLRSELIELNQLSQVTVFARHLSEVKQRYPTLNGRRVIHETVRRMINTLITDLVAQSTKNISLANPRSIDEVRQAQPLIGFSDSIRTEQRELKQFLHTQLYQHFRVNRMSGKARHIIKALFDAFMQDPKLLPPQYQDKAHQDQARAIADYIAGMTDRYAMKEYRHLFSVEEL
ncbi:MAG: deoxyguanosinetriphosphate triphosphohydrolase [Pseudomonadota bacterium]